MWKMLSLFVAVVFFLSGCSQGNAKEKEEVINIVKSYFEEIDNRNFEVSFPTKIKDLDCYKVVVSGKLTNAKTYLIDTFAVNLNNDSKYFFNNETNQFETFSTVPTFACKTSPHGMLRIESVGMRGHGDGPSGLYALKEMRIIELSTGKILWTADSMLSNQFAWSEDSRYVAAVCSGRQWTQTSVIDTSDYKQVTMPGIDDIRKKYPDAEEANENVPMPIFKITKWISPTVLIVNFEWSTNNDTVVTGEYEYDMKTKSITVNKIEEVNCG